MTGGGAALQATRKGAAGGRPEPSTSLSIHPPHAHASPLPSPSPSHSTRLTITPHAHSLALHTHAHAHAHANAHSCSREDHALKCGHEKQLNRVPGTRGGQFFFRLRRAFGFSNIGIKCFTYSEHQSGGACDLDVVCIYNRRVCTISTVGSGILRSTMVARQCEADGVARPTRCPQGMV